MKTINQGPLSLGAAFILIFAFFIARVTSIDQNDTPAYGFSACIVLKDDNDRLSEWLAYHWLVLPLKYLIIAVDPLGTTTPEKIIRPWNDLNMGIEVLLWHDVDYDHWIDEDLDEKHQHRQRQKHFLQRCMLYHKERNRSWVAVIDPDEYITYNTIVDDDPHPYRRHDTDMGERIPTKYTKIEYRNSMYSIRERAADAFANDKKIFDFIHDAKDHEPWKSEICYLMPRLFFSAVESLPHELSEARVEQYDFDVMKFSTLRFLKHAWKGGWNGNHFGKVILDVSKIRSDQITSNMRNIHQPVPSECAYPFKPYETGIFRVHHYIGSWEAYSSKSDPRRSKERFEIFSSVNEGSDYQLQSWLGKFVEKVGISKSKQLLKYIGVTEIGPTRLIDMDGYQRVKKNKESEYYLMGT